MKMTQEEYDRLLMVRKCADNGGPVNVTQTAAKINVCGRCGYTVALHTKWRGAVIDPPERRPPPTRMPHGPKVGLG
jgi:hypothetical protein